MTPYLAKIRFAELRKSGAELDDALAIIRGEGADLFSSVVAVKEVENISVLAAKESVAYSPAWSEDYNQFVDDITAELGD